MSNILNGNTTYFQLPQSLVTSGTLKTMKESELKLYSTLFYQAQRYTTVDVVASNELLQRLSGLAPNSISNARRGLAGRGLLTVKRKSTGYVHSLCDSATGLPFVNHMKEKRKGRGEVDFAALTAGQYRAYFLHHLQTGEVTETKNGLSAQCPFHADGSPSFSIRLSAGQWKCHGCQKSGGLIEFEFQLANAAGELIDRSEARRRVIAVLRGKGVLHVGAEKPEEPTAVYSYTDENGKPLFEVVRYGTGEGKRFIQRRPVSNVPDGYISNLDGVRRVLYRLEDFRLASCVIVVEGEKDVETLRRERLRDASNLPIAITTNPMGAGKWTKDYSRMLDGKSVVIIPDTDDAGRNHAVQIEESLLGYARDVCVVELPFCKDVTEYLEGHNADDLMNLVGRVWFAKDCPTEYEHIQVSI